MNTLRDQYEALSVNELESLLKDAVLTERSKSLCMSIINKKLGREKYKIKVQLNKGKQGNETGQKWLKRIIILSTFVALFTLKIIYLRPSGTNKDYGEIFVNGAMEGMALFGLSYMLGSLLYYVMSLLYKLFKYIFEIK